LALKAANSFDLSEEEPEEKGREERRGMMQTLRTKLNDQHCKEGNTNG
jgi:hypothetical protein